MIDFPWEREAMESRDTPKGLSLTAQKAYQSLSLLYGKYRLGMIDRASGSTEKARILAAWDREKQMDEAASELAKWHARLRKEIEGAQNRYHKDRTLENADKLSRALDGILEGA